MSFRFACTACGKCCSGWIPLTIGDAVAHAGHFPIAVVWTPVRRSDRSFDRVRKLFASFRAPSGEHIGLRVVPTAYIPPQFPCPQLDAEGLCSIHETKPDRCRTMPFFPMRDEGDQASMLVPRAGWDCDTSPSAPVVYEDGRILCRDDFDRELAVMRSESRVIAEYAKRVLASSKQMAGILAQTSGIVGGNVVLGFSTLLKTMPDIDVADVARRQLPMLRVFAEKTAAEPQLAAYHQRYKVWADEMAAIGG